MAVAQAHRARSGAQAAARSDSRQQVAAVSVGTAGGATAATPSPRPSPRPAPRLYRPGASVTAYGARGNGTVDDAPAIRAALAANLNVYIPAGTYLLRSFPTPRQTRLNADFMFSLRSGQSVTADPHAVLVFADDVIVRSPTLWGGNLFMVDGQSDVTISGGTWDFNGAHNLVSPGQTVTGYGVYTYGASHVLVQDVTMQNTPGQNYIVMQARGDDFRVLRSTFRNGGTSLAANRSQTDFSAMYFTGTNVTVDRVHVTHDLQPWYYSGGVELHGSQESVTNSVIEKSWPAIYIGPDDFSHLAVQQGTRIIGNQLLQVGRALVFNAGGTAPIDGVQFSGNTVSTTSFPALGAGRGIDQDAPPDDHWTYHHIITGLSVRDNDFVDADGRTDAGIRLSQIQGGVIQQNRFTAMSGPVLQLASSPWGTRDVTFSGNTATWLGGGGAPAITLSFGAHRADDVRIAANQVTRWTPSSAACAVYLDGGAVSSMSVSGNTFTGMGLSTCGPDAASLVVTP